MGRHTAFPGALAGSCLGSGAAGTDAQTQDASVAMLAYTTAPQHYFQASFLSRESLSFVGNSFAVQGVTEVKSSEDEAEEGLSMKTSLVCDSGSDQESETACAKI